MSLVACAPFLLSQPSEAATIYLGVAPSEVSSASPAGVQTRYKIDNTNWDMMLGNGVAVDNTNMITTNVGNQATLSGQQFTYRVSNVVGQGIVFTLDSAATTGIDRSLSWGNPAGAANSAVNSAKLGGRAPQTTPYNAIHLFSQATFGGSKVTFSNVLFSITDPTIILEGAFATSGEATNATPVVDSYLAYVNSDGTKGDLSNVAWTFSADVKITSTGNPKEGAKFEITGKSLDYTPPSSPISPLIPVPEPSTAILGLFAMGAGVLVRRRPSANA